MWNVSHFDFVTRVLYVNLYVGVFGWLRRSHQADTFVFQAAASPAGIHCRCFSTWLEQLSLVQQTIPSLARTPIYPDCVIHHSSCWGPHWCWFSNLFDMLPRRLSHCYFCSTGTKGSTGFLGCNQIDLLAAQEVFSLHRPQNRAKKEKSFSPWRSAKIYLF